MTVVRIFGSSYGFRVDADMATTLSAVNTFLENEAGDYEVNNVAGQVIIEPDKWRLDRRKLAVDMEEQLAEQFSKQSA